MQVVDVPELCTRFEKIAQVQPLEQTVAGQNWLGPNDQTAFIRPDITDF